jgi:hypothetical protein
VSTAEVVSDISGRGVGMGAVRSATLDLAGSVHVSSKLGAGCTIRFQFPMAETTRMNNVSRYPGARPSLAAPSPDFRSQPPARNERAREPLEIA